MTTPLALVVDDSRMARHVLSKMLKEQGIEVDTVESGEEALGYLSGKKPAMIFMDHTMPGMDGFQTLRAIKNDPLTAAIPIIMYTSKEGEVYESQARALGAVGVLPKTLKPLELVNVLAQQNLLPGQTPPPARLPPRQAANDVVIVENDPVDAEQIEAEPTPNPHQNELHELEQRLQQLTEQLQAFRSDERQAPRRRFRLQHVVLALSVVLIGLLMLYNTQIVNQINDIRADNRRLQEALQEQRNTPAPLPADDETPSPAPQPAVQINQRYYQSMEWALNQEGQFAFGERPFNDKLATTLTRLGEDLQGLNFKGEINVRSHLGRFCTQTTDSGETVLPDEGQPLSSCDIMEFDFSNVDTIGVEQTAGFASFLQSFETEYGEDIRLVLTTFGDRRPLVRYPVHDPDMEAARWNELAARNQRNEISIKPDRP